METRGHAELSWNLRQWESLDLRTRQRAMRARSESDAWRQIVRASRRVLRGFSSSFFVVTRFLPQTKRSQVEVIYAAVRYPDEIVDTFPLPPAEKLRQLNRWEGLYDRALAEADVRRRLAAGVPWILAGFADVVIRNGIPVEHYRAFLEAMRRDVRPAPFPSLGELIDLYIYGSAIVVGYFLTHVYGPAPDATYEDALRSARELGIALQLTNFARDVAEDHWRGRLYLPVDLLAKERLTVNDYLHPDNAPALRRVVAALAAEAERRYKAAAGSVVAFAPDCRTAIRACIEVYERLNQKILANDSDFQRRLTVSRGEKFRALPASKYWRLPLAYVGGL